MYMPADFEIPDFFNPKHKPFFEQTLSANVAQSENYPTLFHQVSYPMRRFLKSNLTYWFNGSPNESVASLATTVLVHKTNPHIFALTYFAPRAPSSSDIEIGKKLYGHIRWVVIDTQIETVHLFYVDPDTAVVSDLQDVRNIRIGTPEVQEAGYFDFRNGEFVLTAQTVIFLVRDRQFLPIDGRSKSGILSFGASEDVLYDQYQVLELDINTQIPEISLLLPKGDTLDISYKVDMKTGKVIDCSNKSTFLFYSAEKLIRPNDTNLVSATKEQVSKKVTRFLNECMPLITMGIAKDTVKQFLLDLRKKYPSKPMDLAKTAFRDMFEGNIVSTLAWYYDIDGYDRGFIESSGKAGTRSTFRTHIMDSYTYSHAATVLPYLEGIEEHYFSIPELLNMTFSHQNSFRFNNTRTFTDGFV